MDSRECSCNTDVSLLLCISGGTVLNSLLTVSVSANSLLAMQREYLHKQLARGSLTPNCVGQTTRSKREIKTADREGGGRNRM